MNDHTFNNPNRPRLKKIKRPIKREDVSEAIFEQKDEKINEVDLQNIDLDSALDSNSSYNNNMPTVAKQAPQTREKVATEFLEESDFYATHEVVPAWLTKTSFFVAILLSLSIGFFVAKMFSSAPQVVRGGLQGVVPNSEVPRGRSRCGLTDKTQGCVLYLMNPQRQELSGRDFYDLAAQLTARQRFMVETGNMRYSNVKIRPGEIGQFNIPPL